MISPVERRVGEFLRELAHEVGNIVHPMHLIVQVLAQPNLDAAMIERLRKGLETQLPSLEKLLHDLRHVSLVAREAVEPKLQPTDVAMLLRNAADRFRKRPEAANVSLITDIPDRLPPVQADPKLLESSIDELLANAARHAPGGQIRLAARDEQNELMICVADDGAGIPSEMLPHVFDLFAHCDEATVRGWGRLGVGLTFVKQVVQKHGGRITAESPVDGQGAAFTVRLPAANRHT